MFRLGNWIVMLLACSCFCSCMKDEPANAECDILSVKVSGDDARSLFYTPADTAQDVPSTMSDIVFHIKRKANVSRLKSLAPVFTLTPGAVISPDNGSTHDFSNGAVPYKVVSEDGQWSRNYTVSFLPEVEYSVDSLEYNFERFDLEQVMPNFTHYYVWHDELPDGSYGNNWATGNPGFSLSINDAPTDSFPTTVMRNGFDGCAVKLTTRSTGQLGAMVGRPIAAGNLFLGTFDLQTALTQTLKATSFGIPISSRPVSLSGYYTYQPGPVMKDEEGKVLDSQDSAAIYAVFYRNTDGAGKSVMLHGDDVKTNSNIVAIADLGYVKPTSKWTPFTINFEYQKDVDLDVLASRGYNITIVFSSSTGGAHFRGALGSTLCIDKVKLICDKEK